MDITTPKAEAGSMIKHEAGTWKKEKSATLPRKVKKRTTAAKIKDDDKKITDFFKAEKKN